MQAASDSGYAGKPISNRFRNDFVFHLFAWHGSPKSLFSTNRSRFASSVAMHRFQIILTGLALAGFTFSTGCQPTTAVSTTTTPTKASTAAHDDHADGEGHDHDHADDEGHEHEGHDHGDEGHNHASMTMASLLGEIEESRSAIEAAYAKDTPDDAHDAMHDVFHLVEDLSAVAKNTDLDEAQTADVKSAQEALLDAFELLDAGLHGGEAKKYSDVADTIKGAMEKLQAIAGKKAE
jgi:hypothetical protein